MKKKTFDSFKKFLQFNFLTCNKFILPELEIENSISKLLNFSVFFNLEINLKILFKSNLLNLGEYEFKNLYT